MVDRLAPLVPRVETVRLVLREPRLDDFPAFSTNAADPLAWVRSGATAVDAREAWRRFHSIAGHWLLQGIGWWVIDAREVGAVGVVGVFRRESGPDVEISWVVYRAHWKQGYASEAARAALGWAMGLPGVGRVIAHIGKENAASVRVAEKVGMHFRGETSFYGDSCWLYVFE